AARGVLGDGVMLAWRAALVGGWWLIARRACRYTSVAIGAFAAVCLAWAVQVHDVSAMVADRNAGPGSGLLGEAILGALHRNLLIDPHWVSPLLLPCLAAWVVVALQRRWVALLAAALLLMVIVAAPFFAVTACSSDAVRYQGALLGLVTAVAVAGAWAATASRRLGSGARALLRVAALAALALLPPRSWRAP